MQNEQSTAMAHGFNPSAMYYLLSNVENKVYHLHPHHALGIKLNNMHLQGQSH
jgi:hypothetical protein